ncbi:MAG: NfeD family protein [Burkholderiaceae bacterium]|jgi:membrane protein implicated in regulation of membrane protease activity|nr:NfeD family protein [Burkholderiaceae bacterium]
MSFPHLQWWYWIVLGVALLLAELALPMFVLVWFGVAAVAVGLLLALLPSLGLTAELTLWLVLSVALVVLWFRVFQSNVYKTRAGMADAAIGEVGLLSKAVAPFGKGEVRFQKPVLGSEVWPCIANESIAAGERVRIARVEGNLITVTKIQGVVS